MTGPVWSGALAAAALVLVTSYAGLGAQENLWPALDLPKIACRGSEHSGRFVEDNPGWGPHLVTLFCTGKNPDRAWHSAQQHLDWASDPLHSYVADGTGALVVWAHPNDRQFADIVKLNGLAGIELQHHGDAGSRERLWDRLLTWRISRKLRPLWGFAGDDTHSTRKIDLCWFAARLKKLNERNLKQALRSGGFYVSNGPVITDIQVEGPTVTVKLARPAHVRWLKRGQYGIGPAVVSKGAGENHCLKFEKSVTSSSYTLNAADGTTDTDGALFIRCVVTTDRKGEAAQTQPFVILSADSLRNPYLPEGQWYKGMTHNHIDALEGSEKRVKDYHAAYAAKGHACAFETGYGYWVMPFLYYPPDRTAVIEYVEPMRITRGRGGKVIIHGRAFAEGAKVLLDGTEAAEAKRLGPDRIELRVRPWLGVGRHDVTVRNPDGLQDTRQYALVVQPAESVSEGWTHYTPQNSKLGSRYTYAVAADNAGGVWVATNHGLNHFDGKTWRLYRQSAEGLLSGTVYDLAVDPDGTVWYTCFRGMGALRPDGTWKRWHGSKAHLPSKQVNQILRLGDATYVTTHNRRGLFVLRGGKWRPIRIGVDLPQWAVITGLAAESSGRLWMSTAGGLLCWDPGKGDAGWTHYTAENSPLPADYLRRVVFDPKGRLWIATATKKAQPVGGLCCLEAGKWKVYDPTNSPLPERRVWSVFVDRDGNVWAATSKGVACLRPDGTWRVFTVTNSGLGDNLVTDICQDRRGNLWFATANGVNRLAAESLVD